MMTPVANRSEVSQPHGYGVAACCLCSDEVQALAQQQLERLYGPRARQPGFQYTAVHMRLGGMKHEASLQFSKGSGNGPVVDLAHGITCIKNLGGLPTAQQPARLAQLANRLLITWEDY